MNITTKSAINISESLACFIIGSHIYHNESENILFEKRLSHVNTGKFSIADVYSQRKNAAFEVKSIAHGNSALKGVVQASMYKEQVDDSILCMQKPRRRPLRDGIESFGRRHGVGVIWVDGVPNICDEQTITRATGGCSKPFRKWKKGRYSTTRMNIIEKSRSELIVDFIETLEQIIVENHEDIFEFAVEPDSSIGGFSEIY